jgi:secreted trypsin-like serine protease
LCLIALSGGTARTFAADPNPPSKARVVLPGVGSPTILRAGDAQIDEWPGFAALRVRAADNSEQFFCGGTAISSAWIVTAAHCMKDMRISKGPGGTFVDPSNRLLEVILGVSDLDQIDTIKNVYQPSDVIVHPKYVGAENGNDIALIKLNREWGGAIADLGTLPLSEGVSPFVRVAGFGGSYYQEPQMVFTRPSDKAKYLVNSQKLKWAELPDVSLRRCAAAYPTATIGAGQICAGQIWGKEDSCTGDSGGPLVSIDYDTGLPLLVGIVSWGELCAQPGKYGVYTRVSAHSAWLRQVVRREFKFERVRTTLLSQQNSKLIDQLEASLKKIGNGKLRIYLANSGDWKIGKVYNIILESDVRGRLILIDLDPEGKIYQIFPNGFKASSHEIDTGTPVHFPDRRVHGFDGFRAAGLPGDGEYIGIVVPDSFPYESLVNHPQLMAEAKKEANGRVEISPDESTVYLYYLAAQVQRAREQYPDAQWGYVRIGYRQR